MKVGAAIAEIMKREGVDILAAYPVNHLIEHAAAIDIRPIIVRQERIGLHMADAISRITSGAKLGAFCMQHGPGTENAYGGIAQAYSESIPILVVPGGFPRRTAQVGANYYATREMRGITKSAESITTPAEVVNVMRRAFSHMRNGRGGPALVEVPQDLWNEEVPEPLNYKPVVATRCGPDPDAVKDAAKLLAKAKRPVIYAGQGVHWARAWPALRKLAEHLGAPVVTSLEGKSAFPEDHPLSLGSGGVAVPKPVRHFLDHADVILGIGCSFTETSFGVPMPKGKIMIHATLDPNHINKDIYADVGLIGDAGLTLDALIEAVKSHLKSKRDSKAVAGEIAEMRKGWLSEWLPKLTSKETPLSPYRVLWDLLHTVDVKNTIITHDAGSPRDQLVSVLAVDRAAHLYRLGQDHAARLWAWSRHGGEARGARQALHQRVGRCGDRVHRHGFRDGGARAHSDSLDSAEQLLHGDRAADHADLDQEISLDRYFRRLRRDGARIRRLWRARDGTGRHRPGDQARYRPDQRGQAGTARVHHPEGDGDLEVSAAGVM